MVSSNFRNVDFGPFNESLKYEKPYGMRAGFFWLQCHFTKILGNVSVLVTHAALHYSQVVDYS